MRPLALRTIRKQIGPLSVAIAALGALLRDTGVYPVEALARAIRTIQSPKIAENAARALSLGAALMRPLDSGLES
jgi:Pyruvate/2-oxoacid:ferredoxin oxidoreductase gamma subunit